MKERITQNNLNNFFDKIDKKISVDKQVNLEKKKVITVVALTPRAGSSFIAMNLARQLAEYNSVIPSFIQLPRTGGNLYQEMRFNYRLKNEYISVMGEMSRFGLNDTAIHTHNYYKGINYVLEVPGEDDLAGWNADMTEQLISITDGPVIIDLGTAFRGEYSQVLQMTSDLIIVIDGYTSVLKAEIAEIEQIAMEAGCALSFVINKTNNYCRSRLKQYISKPYPVVYIPEIDLKYFAKSRNRVVFPYYSNELLALVNLVGFRPMDMKGFQSNIEWISASSIISEKNENEFITPDDVDEVSIGSILPGAGSTHMSLMIATYLQKEYSVAIVEKNSSGAYNSMYKSYSKGKYELEQPNFFRLNEIDIYPDAKYDNYYRSRINEYDFVIYDYGPELKCSSFMESKNKFVLTGSSLVSMDCLKRFYNDNGFTGGTMSFTYLVPFANDTLKTDVCEICEMSDVYSIPFNQDPFKIESSALEAVSEIMFDKYRIERILPKKLFREQKIDENTTYRLHSGKEKCFHKDNVIIGILGNNHTDIVFLLSRLMTYQKRSVMIIDNTTDKSLYDCFAPEDTDGEAYFYKNATIDKGVSHITEEIKWADIVFFLYDESPEAEIYNSFDITYVIADPEYASEKNCAKLLEGISKPYSIVCREVTSWYINRMDFIWSKLCINMDKLEEQYVIEYCENNTNCQFEIQMTGEVNYHLISESFKNMIVEMAEQIINFNSDFKVEFTDQDLLLTEQI